MKKSEKIVMVVAAIVLAASGILNYSNSNALVSFIVSAIALALLAKIVGDGTEQVGRHFGPAATGILQSALGNLPELFVCIFALKAGLVEVVQAALIGSILGNSLLVLGFAIFVGGIKNGKQTFVSGPLKMITTLMILSLAVLAIPTLSSALHTPVAAHINQLDIFLAIVLLVIFIANIFVQLKGDTASHAAESKSDSDKAWPLSLAVIVLTGAGAAAGFVSDWFVNALEPAMKSLQINDTFAGLVIVAIAGNAIENFVGIQLAYKNQPDYSMSVIMNSSLQIALGLFPLLVILSFFLGGAILSFVISPMLLVCLALAVVVSAIIVFDGESIWLEGLALIGLYLLIAAAFWWG
ncbi:MAG: sodium:proton exchanger [Bacteroidota bacterium]|nr:sodium:proton exchanger [Bacteroidota bacterium]